jgi:tRNA-2-methylthio-N6-dimethylallyladenosine synthase
MNNSQPSRRVHITTFGCQMNEYDSDRLRSLLAHEGFAAADAPAEADLVIINTCSVRERAEHKVYSYLGSLRELKQRRPGLIIGVGGCVAQQEGWRLLEQVPYLDLVFGTEALERVPELIEEARRGRRMALTPERSEPTAAPGPRPLAPGRRGLVTVMTGCDNYCSYCVVPYVRGRERSRPAAAVVEEAAALVEAGAREVMLLGHNVNSYADPAAGHCGLDFAGLLEKVAAIDGLWRVRFTTSHPKDLSSRLIEAMAGLDKVMEQLHLPAQSGSDRVLKAMNRGYDRAQYLTRVGELRRILPGVCLGGDIIVGFPGESEQDFTESLSFLDEVGYDYLFSFSYSDRPFTRASRLDDKLSPQEKGRRLQLLQERQRAISLARHQALAGSLAEVLVEGPAKYGQGMMSGRDRGGRVVIFEGGPELKGRVARVRVEQGLVNSLKGRLVEPAPKGVEP